MGWKLHEVSMPTGAPKSCAVEEVGKQYGGIEF